MNTGRSPTLLPVQIAMMAIVFYVASGLLFIRHHVVSGVPVAEGVTVVYLSFPDTRRNRILVRFYSPILAVTDRSTPVTWNHE